LVLGPNINAAMNPDDEPKAYEAVQKAVSLKAKATPRERDLIDALPSATRGRRTTARPETRLTPTPCARLQKKYPEDQDIAAMYAESMMDLRPWGYWMPDGTAARGHAEIAALDGIQSSRRTPSIRWRCTCTST
jgi:hypothetical protein